ncbi:MAG TPA: hypothetical protein VMH89_02445 [Candidatus Acidoferrum sp.]|nr:hypothetical protein [Candidatus Acidoferrum sp.]
MRRRTFLHHDRSFDVPRLGKTPRRPPPINQKFSATDNHVTTGHAGYKPFHRIANTPSAPNLLGGHIPRRIGIGILARRQALLSERRVARPRNVL